MFWVNTPSTVSPITADNLARAERFLLATAGANGDFYVTIPNGVNLALNDVVQISFPAATDGTKAARLSVDGGTTWKTINTIAGLIASTIASKKLTLAYDGTNWVPQDPINWTDGSWRMTHFPDGTAVAYTLELLNSGTFSTLTEISSSGIFYTEDINCAIPANAFVNDEYEVHPSISSRSYVLSINPIYDAAGTISTNVVLCFIKGGSSTTGVAYRVGIIGRWK